MKKLVLLLAVAFGASLVSCVNKATTETEATETVEVVCDSVSECCESASE